MRKEYKLNNDTLIYFLETESDCHELSKELLIRTGESTIIRVESIQAASLSSKVAILKNFCAAFSNYPIVYFAGLLADGTNPPIVTKHIDMMTAEAAGFVSLRHIILEDNMEVMSYAGVGRSYDFNIVIDAYAAAIRMNDIMHNKQAEKVFVEEIAGWKGLVPSLKKALDSVDTTSTDKVKSFD